MRLPSRLALSAVLGSLIAVSPAAAQIDARMLRQPDVSATQIAFVYAGDIGVVSKQGGVAVRLSSRAARNRSPLLAGWQDARLLGQLRRQHDVYTVPVQVANRPA